MREIVTLQLGHLSNYLATHFWNAQESYFTYGDQGKALVDHNVHWRPGLGQDGTETFLPRTVVYDLKGGFGSLRRINPLYDGASTSSAAADSLWSGQPAVHKQEAVSPSAYQQSLDADTEPQRPTASTVRYWSDFSRVYLHPRSAVQLYDFELGSSIRPFERFAMGAELFGSLDKEHDIVDRDWRPFVEECDAMQGIQVLTTLDDAWGGFALSYLEALRDEYPKSCIWVWGLQAPLLDASRQQRQLRLANTAQSLGQSCSMASIVVPLTIPDTQTSTTLAIDRSSPWHVSGLLSTVMESAALPSRLAAGPGQRPTSLSDMAECLNTSGRQTLVGAKMGVGARALEPDADTLDVGSFFPGCGNAPGGHGRIFGQLSTCRGTVDDKVPAEDASGREPRHRVGDPIIRSYTSSLLFPLPSSFPPVFPDASADEAAIPVRAVLSTDSSMSARVKMLQSQTSRSVTLEDREALSSGLMDIADAYQDGWSSGSDEGDDDL
ncbi:tubulin domain-containing protein [Hirsutella rhossiliensis]|uniref:Tubulin domain-containing protein n=1 Tax=Hirsutella rhossiliensis TaxID=111463 RepID=A0A9P8SFX5_9HYPO|nr:tubulin domain-containing protein [Hirsutella rhossiliensis]KAH0960529.1 tubulin domain-containing protein [Hirsutella rhossiliensis]